MSQVDAIKETESVSGGRKFWIFGLRLNAFIHWMKARHTFVELETLMGKIEWEAKTGTAIPINTMRAHMHCSCKVKRTVILPPGIERLIKSMIKEVPREAIQRERDKRKKRESDGLLIGPNDRRRQRGQKRTRPVKAIKKKSIRLPSLQSAAKKKAPKARTSSRPNVQPK